MLRRTSLRGKGSDTGGRVPPEQTPRIDTVSLPSNLHGLEPGSEPWNEVMDMRLRRYGSRFLKVWGYIGIGIMILAVAYLLGHIWDALSVLLFGALMAFIYAPIVNGLERRFKVPRLLGTFIGLIVFFAVILLLFLILVPPLTDQIASFVKAVPGYIAGIQQGWNDVVAYFDTLDPKIRNQISSTLSDLGKTAESWGGKLASTVGSGLFAGVSNMVSGIVMLSMACVISFWLAKDFPRMEREISTIMGPRVGEDYRIITSVFGRSLGGYLKGLVITSSCTGFIAGMGFWFLGIPYSGLLGVITAVLNVIPYIGPWVGGALAFLVGLTVGWVPAILSIVVTVCAQQFTDTFISPKVMQSAVSLHPALVIVALLGGGAIGGIVGMILAVPLTAAVKGVFVYYFEKRTGRQLVSKQGALFKGEPFLDAQGNPRPACDALGIDIEGDKGVPPRIKEEVERERRQGEVAREQTSAPSTDSIAAAGAPNPQTRPEPGDSQAGSNGDV